MSGNVVAALPYVVAAVPFVLLIILAVWGGRMQKVCKFRAPPEPVWPYAENPGLALELADSLEFVDAVLGRADTKLGPENRAAAIRLQKLDFVLIPLYVLFFAAAALEVAAVLKVGSWTGALVAIGCVLLAAILDVAEDIQILRMAKGVKGSSAKRFGQLKWLFYFATLAAEGVLFFSTGPDATARAAAGMVLGTLLIATAIGGVIPALKGSFVGISSATKLSLFGLIGLALAPLVAVAPFSWRDAVEYAVLMRVPLLVGAILFFLPFIAFFTGARSLLRGLFDLTPLSLFVVALSSLAVAGTACMTASLVLLHASERFRANPIPSEWLPSEATWLLIMTILSLPAIGFCVGFSARQKRGFGRLILAALGGAGLALGVAWYLVNSGLKLATTILPWLSEPGFTNWLASTGLFAGYVTPVASEPWSDHLSALAALLCVLVLYAVVGIYGWTQLGKNRTVPALASALMLVMMLGWMLSGAAFFFDQWRFPLLLVVGLVGTLTAQSVRSDHFYHLRRRTNAVQAPDPAKTIGATKRVVVVAANGGGIQAGAWAAQVLYGLYEDRGEPFLRSLRMISSVSGGSVGSACFVHWLANRKSARQPAEAAAKSSLDEVAWGLAWPDFLRALAPWIFGWFIGRGRALEKAWCLNSAPDAGSLGQMDEPLSSWNEKVAQGQLPAIVMNATIAETGERLLLATTQLGKLDAHGRARSDATELHLINGQKLDVGVVTAARLSASFPYVTPAARSDGQGPQPHVVDGGYYDNYGMATMVEWLDEALSGAGKGVESVLVIQVHGSPVNEDLRDERHAKSRGWFYQAIAPLATLAAVRSAGQIAHNDIEMELLQQKWTTAGVPVHSVTFEFCNPNAPLSWHLTPEEVDEIRETWREQMTDPRKLVENFLGGSDSLGCGCPRCKRAAAGA